MEENFKIKFLKIFVVILVYNTTYHPLKHLNRMVMLNERIGLLFRHLDLCLVNTLYRDIFCARVVNTSYYVLNGVYIKKKLNKTPYQLLKGKIPNLSHLHILRCKFYVLNNGRSNVGKFDSKFNEGIFLDYSTIY